MCVWPPEAWPLASNEWLLCFMSPSVEARPAELLPCDTHLFPRHATPPTTTPSIPSHHSTPLSSFFLFSNALHSHVPFISLPSSLALHPHPPIHTHPLLHRHLPSPTTYPCSLCLTLLSPFSFPPSTFTHSTPLLQPPLHFIHR